MQKILSAVLSSALEVNAEVAAAHDRAIETIKARTGEGLDAVLSALEAAATSSSAMEERIVSLSAWGQLWSRHY